MPEHSRIPLEKIIPRATAEAISLMEWMMNYNPKNRPRPSQILSHEFFKTKQLGTAQKTGNTETTAETNKSKVESLVIGTSGLQLKTKMLDTF
jgi:serine/threonine protein kinase